MIWNFVITNFVIRNFVGGQRPVAGRVGRPSLMVHFCEDIEKAVMDKELRFNAEASM